MPPASSYGPFPYDSGRRQRPTATLASPFWMKLSASGDETQRILAAQGLMAGSKTRYFSRIGGAETQGALPALDSWRPATNEEAIDYIEGCVSRLLPSRHCG